MRPQHGPTRVKTLSIRCGARGPQPIRAWSAFLFALTLPALVNCGGASTFGLPAQGTNAALGGHAHPANSYSWSYTTLDNPDDLSFNELTGISNIGKICGFYGTVGSTQTPARSYCIQNFGKDVFRKENYPNALDTVITSVNSAKSIAGWYLPETPGLIFGCVFSKGIWTSYKDPKLRHGTSNITELLGINQAGLAVGFYTDDLGVNHGFELDTSTGKFHGVNPPGGVSVEATGINGKGDIVGVMTTQKGSLTCLLSDCKSFLLKGGHYTVFSYSSAVDTEALAVNWQDQIVGSYLDALGITHAFVLTSPLNQPLWQSIDEPKAVGFTVLTSIQDKDFMVGYYLDGSGNTNGFLATPK
jgi:hypothetical protein